MVKLSICIPTYNRAANLDYLLRSIKDTAIKFKFSYQICVSDNNSTDNTKNIVYQYEAFLPIKYSKNSTNKGLARNIIDSVDMADGEWAWLVGDDDIFLPNSYEELNKLMLDNSKEKFILTNCYKIDSFNYSEHSSKLSSSEFLATLTKNSRMPKRERLNFMNLIDHRYTFDFLGGMFLSIFKTKYWERGKNKIDLELANQNNFHSLESTFPHLCIFQEGFFDEKSIFIPNPLLLTTSSERDWALDYPFIKLVMLPEALIRYKRLGLQNTKYYLNMNSLHSNFFALYFLLIKRSKKNFSTLRLTIFIFFRSLIFLETYISIFTSPYKLIKNFNNRI
jgi:glycosyltransferase involved in cell wall biosynthesis